MLTDLADTVEEEDEYEQDNPDFMVPIVFAPEDFVICVAGGDGRHSAWLSSWFMTQCATEKIEP